MTTGQRVAQKRKELGLSQEALGEKLGVSRQSIYKWESDSALPEVEKLVALSRLFGVSVGWLLGVEEDAAPGGGELEQLALVEKIAARYAPRLSPRRLAVVKIAAAAAAVCLCGVLYSFSRQLDGLRQNYDQLQSSISQVQNGVNGQISGISNRVEELLKAQNDVAADYGCDLVEVDPSASRAFFQAYAVPKHYVEGMTAEFYGVNGGWRRAFGAEKTAGQRFVAEVTCGLMENITLGVDFIYPDGSRQTQLLDTYQGLYGQTFPEAWADYALGEKEPANRALALSEDQRGVLYQSRDTAAARNGAVPVAELESLRVGLFRNRKLVDWAIFTETPGVTEAETDALTQDQWAALGERPDNLITFYFPAQDVPLEPGDVLQEAVVLRDIYGRTAIRAGRAYGLEEGKLASLGPEISDAYPSNWMLPDGSSICS